MLLTSCTLLPPRNSPEAEAAWQARKPALERIERFTLQGRFAAGALGVTGGNLSWRQAPEQFEIRLSGPMGGHATLLRGDDREVEVQSEQESFRTSDPETALQQRFGWSFPVSHLRYWALGLPAPGSSARVELDESGHVLLLDQDGWIIGYDRYSPAGPLELPRKFYAERDEVTLRVVVDSWRDVGPVPAP